VRNSSPLQNALAKLIEGRDPTQLDWQERWQIVCEGVFLGKFFTLLRPSNAPIRRALGALLSGGGGSREISEKLENVAAPEERFSILMNLFANRLENHLFSSFAQRLNHGNPLQAVQELAMLLPALAPLSAYLLELRCESADRAWFHTLSLAMVGQRIPQFGVPKTAWFTDTLRDINGVSTTIRSLAEAAHTQGIRVTVLSCSNHAPNDGPHYQNFHPVREFTLPEYEQQRLAIPPVLEIVKHISENAFTEVLVSTPGPMGLVGLLVARLLRLPVRGIYHTDFPRYVRILTEDPTLEAITWNYMRWFYTDLDELLVNSDPYRDEWIARGVYPSKIRILPRGVDRTLFHPSRRRVEFWRQYGVPENQKVLLYVGRISREKGLDLLVPMMEILAQQPLTLALVGDGPYAQELRAFLPGAVFTGPLRDLALAEAYASADLFVFPSSTDTFGNVVLEALASGLPCVVSDTGGPAKLVQDGCSGLIAKAGDPGDFSEKITRFLKDSDLIPGLQQRAADSVKNWDWSRAAAHLFVSP
jgi:glycosyltransferase involved in cell wall biosynthesis